MAALALPATAYASLTAVDNPWGIATNRAAEVGKQLAEVLLMREQVGSRQLCLSEHLKTAPHMTPSHAVLRMIMIATVSTIAE